MPDPTPTPNPTPAPTPNPPPKRDRSPINQEWIQTRNDAQQIVRSAQKPTYAAAFTDGGITAAQLSALAADIDRAIALAGSATQKTTGKKTITKTETELREALIELVQEVQKRARQKYAASQPAALKDYGIGEKWTNNRAALEQTAANLIAKLARDALPGMSAAKATALQTALDAYRAVQTEQTGGQSDATTDRAGLAAAVKGIVARRRELQFAADAQWPHTKKTNAGLRAEFKLPPDRPMK